MEFKGTKGEWRQTPSIHPDMDLRDYNPRTIFVPGNALFVATAYGLTNELSEANAKLIAAAPDMLKALIAIVEDGKSHPAIIGLAEKAITKALEE